MEHKKLIKFLLLFLCITIVFIFLTASEIIPNSLKMYLTVGLFSLMILLIFKLIIGLFKKDKSLLPEYHFDTFGREVFCISTYRSTILSLVMILLPILFIWLFIPLFPDMIPEINSDVAAPVIGLLLLDALILIASGYCLLAGIKLFNRRSKIVQLIINDNEFEFFPIYDFGLGRQSFMILSMYFRKEMRKIDFNDRLRIEKITDKWSGDKIRISMEGVRFYLPFLYNDANELEGVYQNLKRRLQRKITGGIHEITP